MSEDAPSTEGKPEHLDRLSSLWRRVNEHKLVQWSVAYIAIAYAIQHAVILTSESFEWPNAVARISMLLFVLGLPLMMTLAWYHGARASRNFSRAELSILTALLAIGSLLFYVFVQPSEPGAGVQQAGVAAARTAAGDPATALSIAVLPFDNISGDASQEFFSDGITEEITAALAKVPDLRVVARTSAFQFKAQNRDIQSIGQQLHATHFIEGSVRKAGTRVRITAQLIKADDGSHLWGENYDRELTDIFAIQEDIARAITASLRMPLGLKPGENLVNNRNVDPDSHEKFLRGKALVDARGGFADYQKAQALLSEAVTKSPDYAPAWAWLSLSYFFLANAHAVDPAESLAAARELVEQLRAKGEAAAQRAIQSDPNLAVAYTAAAVFKWTRAKPLEAEELFVKALSLDPIEVDTLGGYALRIGSAGRLKEALAMIEKALAVEPLHPTMLLATAEELWLNNQTDAAVALAKTLRPADRGRVLGMIYASTGRYGEAADALEAGADPDSGAAQAARILRTAPAKAAAPEKLPRLPQTLEFVYAHVGAPDRANDTYDRRADIGYFGGNQTAYIWHPAYAAVRKTERFRTLMRKAGLVEYWRAKGWPPQCHPTTGDDFACE